MMLTRLEVDPISFANLPDGNFRRKGLDTDIFGGSPFIVLDNRSFDLILLLRDNILLFYK